MKTEKQFKVEWNKKMSRIVKRLASSRDLRIKDIPIELNRAGYRTYWGRAWNDASVRNLAEKNAFSFKRLRKIGKYTEIRPTRR